MRGEVPTPGIWRLVSASIAPIVLWYTVNRVSGVNTVRHLRRGHTRSCELLICQNAYAYSLSHDMSRTTLQLPCCEAKPHGEVMLLAQWLPVLVFLWITMETLSEGASRWVSAWPSSHPQPLSPPSWGSRHRGAETSLPRCAPSKSLGHRTSDHN